MSTILPQDIMYYVFKSCDVKTLVQMSRTTRVYYTHIMDSDLPAILSDIQYNIFCYIWKLCKGSRVLDICNRIVKENYIEAIAFFNNIVNIFRMLDDKQLDYYSNLLTSSPLGLCHMVLTIKTWNYKCDTYYIPTEYCCRACTSHAAPLLNRCSPCHDRYISEHGTNYNNRDKLPHLICKFYDIGEVIQVQQGIFLDPKTHYLFRQEIVQYIRNKLEFFGKLSKNNEIVPFTSEEIIIILDINNKRNNDVCIDTSIFIPELIFTNHT